MAGKKDPTDKIGTKHEMRRNPDYQGEEQQQQQQQIVIPDDWQPDPSDELPEMLEVPDPKPDVEPPDVEPEPGQEGRRADQ